MSKTLEQIAQELKDSNKKVQLIYAFNGTGKTRLSRALKDLIAPKQDAEEDQEPARKKFLYYNAFTEDLFYWDNDLEADAEPKLKIQKNTFTDWLVKILKDQGAYQNIITNFQRYANDRITPRFNEEYTRTDVDGNGREMQVTVPAFSETTFSIQGTVPVMHDGENVMLNEDNVVVLQQLDNIKISKGEESNLIWSIFYTLLQEVVSILDEPDPKKRDNTQFNELEYIFIDDPVSSLDENHLIQLAVDLALLIKSAPSALKFIITTHNPFFYNVMHNELSNKTCYLLERFEDGTLDLHDKQGDSNKSFSYHLHLKEILEKAIAANQVEKYHFTLLRNLYEKTASFLGYQHWSDLLPEDGKELYLQRVINFNSHRTLSGDETAEPSQPEKQTVNFLLNHLLNNYGYQKLKEEKNG